MLTRPFRFRELSREVNITPRLLAKELQELEQHRLVKRTVCNTRPITVEYASTAYSRTLLPVVQALSDWGHRHNEVIVGHRRPCRPGNRCFHALGLTDSYLTIN